MNAPIARLFIGILVLFTLLVAFTSNWAVFDAENLQAKSENKRPLFEAQRIERGKILTVDGETIADSKKKGKGDSLRYVRKYPLGDLFGNPVGYSFISQGQVGLERTEQDVLTGQSNEFVSLLDQVRGQAQAGSDIVTTLNAAAQRVAAEQLAGRPGAVVAIEPSTGAVRVMQSTPGYDPNSIPTDISKFNQDPTAPLVDRPVQSIYPPGSTMKVVTAAAALDSGKVAADEPIDAISGMNFSGVPLANDYGQDFPGETMQDALTNSVNTYFAQVGERVGADTLLEYMRRFGFERDPQVELPDDEKGASGVYNSKGQLVDSGFDIARVAIGQGGEEGQVLASPMQMAEVAATIANGGTLMKPTLIQQIKDPDG
ncbi:MAG: penicillin-binding transpeptidase domain-containing protein, partial [Acidimicrobiales bacterium]